VRRVRAGDEVTQGRTVISLPSRERERLRRTARTRAGTADATARAVVGRTVMTRELADGPGRRRGSQPRCGNSSWTRSTAASRSGNTARSWAALQSGVGAYQDRPGVVKEIGGGLDGNPPGRPPPCDGCQVLPTTARKPVVDRDPRDVRDARRWTLDAAFGRTSGGVNPPILASEPVAWWKIRGGRVAVPSPEA
jgi:hypothetical protein